MQSRSTAGTLALVTVLLLGCRPPDPPNAPPNRDAGKTRVTLQLNWFPEAEHGGFYAALVHGYFAEEGLDVRILPGGPGVQVVAQVAAAQADFGVANADRILVGQAQEARTVALLAPLQHSPRCIMVHADSGIRQFGQLRNLTLAMSNTATFSLFLQRRVPLEGVQIVPYPGNVARFLLEKNYAQQAYVFSEPFLAREQGAEPHNLMVSDLGFNPYTSCLISHPGLIADRADVVQRMVRASRRGWRKYLESPGETNRFIHDQNPEMPLDILQFGAEQLRDLCLDQVTSPEQIGRMEIERWQTLSEQLIEAEVFDAGQVDVPATFTTRFLGERSASPPEAP